MDILLNMVYIIITAGDKRCDRRTGDEPDGLSSISQILQGGQAAATGGPVHVPGVLSTIRRPHQKGG